MAMQNTLKETQRKLKKEDTKNHTVPRTIPRTIPVPKVASLESLVQRVSTMMINLVYILDHPGTVPHSPET
jgi:hypothetical protein